MKLMIVDAFTHTIFGGNPAGVLILRDSEDFPAEESMRKTAAELRYSETAFVKQLNDKEFHIRYFTPAGEVDLCGHATIASFVALLYLGKIEDNSIYLNHTKAGVLNIELRDGSVMMDMATPVEIATIDDIPALTELYEVMGTSYDPASIKLLPKLVSTGLPDIMMPVATREDLDAIDPDMRALSALSKRYNVVGVHAFTLDAEDGVTAYVRNFAPLYNIDEEAATGTANGALTYYLHLQGLIDPVSKCCMRQGEKMDRPSTILTEISADGENCLIKVGGSASIVVEGEINI